MTIVPIRGLFEAHLTVSDLERAIAFYRDVLGLKLAHRIPARQVAFFWVPASDKAMLGLWSIGTSPLRMRLHIAFDVALPQVFESVAALRRAGLVPRSGDGKPSMNRSCCPGCRRPACISTIRTAIRWSS
jgi:lactoylglutathione lyase